MSIYCNICNKNYSSEKTYLCHLKTSFKHQNKNPFICSFCKKEYSNSSSFYYHKTVCKEGKEKIKVDEIKQCKEEFEIKEKEYIKIVQAKDNKIIEMENQMREMQNQMKEKENQIFQLTLSLYSKNAALIATKEVYKELHSFQNIYNNETFIQSIQED